MVKFKMAALVSYHIHVPMIWLMSLHTQQTDFTALCNVLTYRHQPRYPDRHPRYSNTLSDYLSQKVKDMQKVQNYVTTERGER